MSLYRRSTVCTSAQRYFACFPKCPKLQTSKLTLPESRLVSKIQKMLHLSPITVESTAQLQTLYPRIQSIKNSLETMKSKHRNRQHPVSGNFNSNFQPQMFTFTIYRTHRTSGPVTTSKSKIISIRSSEQGEKGKVFEDRSRKEIS